MDLMFQHILNNAKELRILSMDHFELFSGEELLCVCELNWHSIFS
jgi:hypothetical protein